MGLLEARRRSSSGSRTTIRSRGASPRRSTPRAPRSASRRSRASSRSGSGRSRASIGRPSWSPATSSPTSEIRARLRALGRDPPVARHPRPRARLRRARGPLGRLRRHVTRRVRAGARRVGLLARRARTRGPTAPAARVVGHDADLLRRREGGRQLQRDGRREAALEASVRYLAAVHGHLHCIDCGTTWEIEADEAAALVATLARRRDFAVDVSHLSIAGRCRACGAALDG